MPFLATEHFPIPNKDLISWIFDEPKYDPDKPVYIDAKDPSRSISLRQARSIVRKLAAGFHAIGVKKGDCVCLHAFNDILYPMIFLGIVAVGGCFAGSNPAYTQFELVHHIKTAKSKFLITEPELLGNVAAAAKECDIPSSKIFIFNVLGQAVPAGFQSWGSLLQHGERDWVRFNDEKTSKETTAARLFSSGTTGLPKAAILSHYNFIAQHTLVFEYKNNKDYDISRVLCLPMFHAATVPVAHTTAIKAGHKSYIMRRFELEPMLSYIEKYQCTECPTVPPLVISIIMSPATKKYSLRSVRSAACGAAPLGPGPQAVFRDLLSQEPKATFTQVWGMTETSCIATMFRYPEFDDTGSVGYALPGVDIKLADDDGNDITAYDVRGEMCVRGPIVVSGYFENPKANAESFDSEGYFKTGDIMYRDSKTDKWYIVDRKKELIKIRGFQVAPPEIESVLLAHPFIIDAAVIGVQTSVKEGHTKGEVIELPRAYVVRRPGKEGDALDEAKVKAWCAERLAKFKELSGGVKFIEAIPRNASGKILKRLLREDAEREEKANGARL